MSDAKYLAVNFQGDKAWVKVNFSGNLQYCDLESAAREQLNIRGGKLEIFDENSIKLVPATFSELAKESFILRHTETCETSSCSATESASTGTTSIVEDSASAVHGGGAEGPSNIVKAPELFYKLIVKELREYFKIQRTVVVKGSDLLKKTSLNSQERKKVIHIVANHLLLFRPNPKKADKIAYAKATIELFPCLKIDTELGYDSVYNPKNRAGFLGNCLRRKIFVRKSTNLVFDSEDEENENVNPSEDELDDSALESIKEDLKVCCWRQHKRKIVDCMKKTFKYRRNFLQTSLKSNILLEYPRFQDTYGLIHQDFKTLYPDDHENLVGLFQPDFQEKLQTLGNLNTITGQNKGNYTFVKF
ncbi:uncharacterized protein LOC129803873 [Phlebotomus papatasi]|uniref:uncharacterized protein LOC129803873 n=1 Tax=Phlebotomus papatasi TaxID=29031 RepID=UPI002483D68C|nr:uncharacterized protein LOC129803873 [Phlebotomus papatasi]